MTLSWLRRSQLAVSRSPVQYALYTTGPSMLSGSPSITSKMLVDRLWNSCWSKRTLTKPFSKPRLPSLSSSSSKKLKESKSSRNKPKTRHKKPRRRLRKSSGDVSKSSRTRSKWERTNWQRLCDKRSKKHCKESKKWPRRSSFARSSLKMLSFRMRR